MNKKVLERNLPVRLKLDRSRIRLLTADQLALVAGAVPPPTKSGIEPLKCN
jgi:hypothetical protein